MKPYIPLLGGIHIKYNRYLAYTFDPTGEHLFCIIQISSKYEIIESEGFLINFKNEKDHVLVDLFYSGGLGERQFWHGCPERPLPDNPQTF